MSVSNALSKIKRELPTIKKICLDNATWLALARELLEIQHSGVNGLTTIDRVIGPIIYEEMEVWRDGTKKS